MIKRIILATNNAHKLNEFKEIFAPYHIDILSLNDVNIISDPDECKETFQENALIKALSAAKGTDDIIVSDDSGLCIHALNDFPGIHSSRFMEEHPYKDKWLAINEMLRKKDDKSAHFQSTLCVINLEKEPLYFTGQVFGKIVKPRGENGFGYDPIFYVEEKKKTFGEMTAVEKNELSHRKRAIEQFLNYLLKHNYIKQ